jgi:opacity protein-like surface antigen
MISSLSLMALVAAVGTSSTSEQLKHPAPAPVGAVVSVSETHASPHEFALYLRTGPLYVGDAAVELVSEGGSVLSTELGFGYSPIGLSEAISFNLGLIVSGSSSQVFQSFNSGLFGFGLRASATYGLPLFDYVRVYGRAGVSAELLELSMETFETTSDTELVLGAEGLLGLELTLPLTDAEDSRLGEQLVFAFEAGYGLRSSAAFEDVGRTLDEDAEPAPIGVTGAHLGELNLSGWTWRLGVGVLF